MALQNLNLMIWIVIAFDDVYSRTIIRLAIDFGAFLLNWQWWAVGKGQQLFHEFHNLMKQINNERKIDLMNFKSVIGKIRVRFQTLSIYFNNEVVLVSRLIF